MPLKARVRSGVIELTGPLSEAARPTLDELRALPPGAYDVNFAGVTYVNSMGARDWIVFLSDFSKAHAVTLDECPPQVAAQFAMLPAFVKGARVRSIVALYHCDDCLAEAQAPLELHDGDPRPATPAPPCSGCGRPMSLDESLDVLFPWADGI